MFCLIRDTWFSSPAQLIAVKNLGLDSIAMIRKGSRIYYEYEGEQLSIKKIFGICKKRRGRSKKNKKDWIAFICTNPELSEEEIIRIPASLISTWSANATASHMMR